MTNELPPWAAKAIRTEVGDEPVTDFRVLKESPFSKIVVGYTPTQTVVAERGFFGAVAWRVDEVPTAQTARTIPSAAATKAPARRYKSPTEVEERIEGIGPAYAKKLF
ncbi:MAG TPA: hypothetical protein VGR28_07290, partial [Candidatus Thermoplasmatota archaeon]|nr:hypothetical protein [Candidatus Thermoplasmatota archaeon]